MQQVTIRPAATSEQTLLEAIQWRASLNNYRDRDALLANPDAIELPLQQIENGGVFVAEIAGSVIGFAAILPRDDGDTELDAIFVEPEAWRQGVGRSLVEYCASAAKSTGAASIHVVGNPHAKDFYVACGFQMHGTHQTRFGIGLLLRREL